MQHKVFIPGPGVWYWLNGVGACRGTFVTYWTDRDFGDEC